MSKIVFALVPRPLPLGLLALALGACATATREGPPAPVVSATQRPGAVEPAERASEATPRPPVPAVPSKPQTRTYAYREPGTEPEPTAEAATDSRGQPPRTRSPASSGPTDTAETPPETRPQTTPPRAAAKPPAPTPAPASAEPPAAPRPGPENQVASASPPPAAAVPPPAPPAPVDRSPAPALPPAADGLARQAEQQRQQGDYAGAAATLERSLRIAPREAYLWNRLARVRMEQGLAGQAAQLAARSNDLAGNQENVKRDNWRIIAESRRRAGDMAGASEAEQRAGGG